jgi:hypothetical protein
MKSWLERTHSPVLELTRHFFLGLFRSESFAGEDSFSPVFVQILGLLIAASWYIPVQVFGRYVEINALPDGYLYHLAYSIDTLWMLLVMSVLIALVAVFQWPSLFPSQRDHFVLSPLPLTRIQIFGGKVLALSTFFAVCIIAITFLSSLVFPVIANGRWETRPYLLRAAALLTGTTTCTLFMVLAAIALQGLLLAILPVRWFRATSFSIQIALLLLILCAAPVLPYFPGRQLVEGKSHWLLLMPPAWFWGWNEQILGTTNSLVANLALRAKIALPTAFFLASTTYLISYLRYTRQAMESVKKQRRPLLAPAEWISRVCTFSPKARAVSSFLINTLLRGQRQKLIFFLLAGVGLALIIENSVYLVLSGIYRPRELQGAIRSAVLSLPLTLSFFAMVALRRVFRIPADLRANWLFRFLDSRTARPAQLNAVLTTFLILGGLTPLILSIPVECVVFGPKALIAITLQAALIFTLAQYLLIDWRSIPFTFAETTPRRHLIQSLTLHFGELAFYSFIGAEWIESALNGWRPLVALLLMVAGAYAFCYRRRAQEWGNEPLDFADTPPPILECLNLLTP